MKNREFDYFLFDNFDVATVPVFDNPRSYLNKSADKILSDVVNAGAFGCSYNEMCNQYTRQQIDTLIQYRGCYV